MRLFLINWGNKEQGVADVALDLQKNRHKIVYWVRRDKHLIIDHSVYPNTIFHDSSRALGGKSSRDINDSEFKPPSLDLLNSLIEYEPDIMLLLERDFPEKSLVEKIQIYHDLLKYWLGTIKLLNPDIIVFSLPPHRIFELVIYALAKILGIKTIILYFTVVTDRIFVMNDYQIGNKELQEFLKDTHSNYLVSDLSKDLQDYYHKQVEDKEDVTPSDTADRKKTIPIIKVIKRKACSIFNIKSLVVLFKKMNDNFREFTTFLRPNLKKDYSKLQVEVDFSKKYIYLPLAFQPELTTCPLGGRFHNQLLMIETVSVALPKDWVIYVKEHKTQWTLHSLLYTPFRPKGFYERINRLKNVKLVPVEVDSRKLTRYSQAVAVVTGTAGWEAVLRSKPALVFGYAWYKDCHGVFQVRSIEDCCEVFEKINSGFRVEQNKVLNYLHCFDMATSHGYFDKYGRENSTLSVEENANNIVQLLLKYF
ncbi:MAG: hypothetical protein HQ538_01290 [Parcubacteria group bacterium]|nr:hypothetical protein [Parcubacteria group bacterium]